MVKVKAFRGFFAKPSIAQKLISYPYDVIDTEEARQIAKNNQYSFLHVNKPQIDLPKNIDHYDEQVYQKGKENLDYFVQKGWIQQEQEPILYIYAQTFQSKTQFGIVLEASTEDYDNNIIKKHELTRKKKEQDRTDLTYIQNANIGPVFLAYQENTYIDDLVAQIVQSRNTFFDCSFDDGVRHQVWKCNTQESEILCKAFELVPIFYIADGHHRCASAYNVAQLKKEEAKKAGKEIKGDEDFNYFLAIAYPKNQLNIYDYNRVIKDLNGKTPQQIISEIEEQFIVKKATDQSNPKPRTKGQFSMFLEKQWYDLKIKPQFVNNDDTIQSLDVQILTDKILNPILGISDITKSTNIDFIGGIRGMSEIVKRCNLDCKIGFAVFPLNFDAVMKVADENKIMPPKSTWFEPKPRSGCIVRIMDKN